MQVHELARWTRFAAKGGIGKCTAVQDCVAQSSDDLMFMKGDEITVLMQLQDQPDTYLGHCEGVVGRFGGSLVAFHGPLKRPVLTRRASGQGTPSPSHSRPPSNSPRPSPSPVPEPNEEVPSSVPPSPSPPVDTPHPGSIQPTHSDTQPQDFDDESIPQSSLTSSSSSASPAIESAPTTPTDLGSTHQDSEPRPRFAGSPAPLENPAFDETKELESSYAPSEESTRLSVATIDGTEGIGLSLLQNFMGSGGDSDSDASSDTDMAGYVHQESPDSPIDEQGLDYDSTPPRSTDDQHSAPKPASASTSPISPSSRVSHVSSHPSEYSDLGGEEWEGASDIYDNYRYSRFSVASKISTFSKASMKAPPPIPLSGQRPSVEQDVVPKRPAPLDLEVRSPLLHTTFGSPLNSPGERTAVSTPSTPLTPAGVATAIRHRLEVERGPGSPTTTDARSTPVREGDIVISDDEEGPEVIPGRDSDSPRPSSPADAGNETLDSTTSSRGAEDDSFVTDETIPVTHPLPETQPLRLTRSPSLPPPQETHPAPPSQPLAIAQPRPNKPSAFDFGSSRTSMFLPHPGAPKAPGTAPIGPLYGRVQSPPSVPGIKNHQASLIELLQVVASTPPNGPPRTVYGKCEVDLANAVGPVPITFSLVHPNSVPANRIVPLRSQSNDSHLNLPISSQPSTPTDQSSPLDQTGTGSKTGAIPRLNFFPQTPQVRPRSRSFSGFDSIPSRPSPSPGHSEDDASKKQSPQGKKPQPKPKPELEPPRLMSSRRPNTMNRPVHKPSPLSLPQNSISSDTSADSTLDKPRTPTSATATSLPSPLSPRSFNSSSLATSPPLTVPTVLRQAVSSIQLRTPGTNPVSSSLPSASPTSVSQQTNGNGDETLSRPAETAHSSKLLDQPRPSTSSSESSRLQNMTDTTAQKSPGDRVSFDVDSLRTSDTRSISVVSPSLHSTSPPPSAQKHMSLRSKLSKNAIMAKTSGPDTFGGIQPPTSPISATETVQVEDMDFELVKPSFPRTSPRSSLESIPSHENNNDHQPSPIRQDSVNLLRPESPSSLLSTAVSEKEAAANRRASPASIAPSELLSPSDIDAHRNRELKWVSLMSTLDPAQARKSKKVKKLLLNGVPASVRYQVWAHLADCKGKRMNGLYPQLVQRGAVPATSEISRDSANRFGDQPQGKDGSIVSVLQAYLTMVPDVRYNTSLACIVGQLLAQAPEEDAFWIFISMMDSYLRPYFSSIAVQLDFDATLFAKALGANDPPLAKRIFVDMSIPPSTICRQWFCPLFYDAIPAEYHLRVWDVFLFEGVPFLFRVALALFTCCRGPLLEVQSRDRALSILSHVPPQCLPPSGDALIELAMSKKLKDDDVRKARSKVEAQKKRNNSTRVLKSSVNSGAPISLPRG